jgi:peptide deformylase
MALRNIFLQGEPILRQTCKDVTGFDSKLEQLLEDMHETLDQAQGAGLAANQVGILRNIFVLHNEDKRLEFINPKISEMKGEVIDTEGCLSCPGEYGKVKRPQTIKVTATDRQGKSFSLTLKDLDARIACHEADHLVGKIFKDIAIELHRVGEE